MWLRVDIPESIRVVIGRINTRKEELLGKLRVTSSIWEIRGDCLDEVMKILEELGLKAELQTGKE